MPLRIVTVPEALSHAVTVRRSPAAKVRPPTVTGRESSKLLAHHFDGHVFGGDLGVSVGGDRIDLIGDSRVVAPDGLELRFAVGPGIGFEQPADLIGGNFGIDLVPAVSTGLARLLRLPVFDARVRPVFGTLGRLASIGSKRGPYLGL